MKIPIDQIIAWGMTIVAITLFIVERRKNDKKPIYMALQGLLKSTYSKYSNHNAHFGHLTGAKMNRIERPISIDEYALYAQMVASDMESQIEQILGIMKSLGIEEDIVIDKEIYTGHKASLKEFDEKMHEFDEKR